jgi:DNA-binding winged helix-turn-helix (wHTH) protein
VQLQFGAFRLDTDTRQLLHGDDEAHLTPKAFDLLVLLVASRPKALSKAELHERLWPATFVTEANLANLIAEIRQVLGDAAGRPRFIRTVHRYGYAFVGDVASPSARGRPSTGAVCWLTSKTREFALEEGEHLVGRLPEAEVSIRSASVSRRHARIAVAATGATLEDLGSKNGTWLRGRRISSPTTLKNGDRIRFGSATVTFRSWTVGATTRSATPPMR